MSADIKSGKILLPVSAETSISIFFPELAPALEFDKKNVFVNIEKIQAVTTSNFLGIEDRGHSVFTGLAYSGYLSDLLGEKQIVRAWDLMLTTSGQYKLDAGVMSSAVSYENVQTKVSMILEGEQFLTLAFEYDGADFPIDEMFRANTWATNQLIKPVQLLAIHLNSTGFDAQIVSFDNPEELTSCQVLDAISLGFEQNVRDPEVLDRVSPPQADDPEKLVLLLDIIKSGRISASHAASVLEFSERQASYYLSALTYLKLATRGQDKGFWFPSPLLLSPNKLVSKSEHLLATAMLANTVLSGYFSDLSDKGLEYVQNKFFSDNVELAEETKGRRFRTLIAWHGWLKHYNERYLNTGRG